MRDRRRNLLILLLVAGLVAGSVVAIALKKTVLGLDLKGGVELVYQAKPSAASQVNSTSLARTIAIMIQRVDQLGVSEPTIEQYGGQDIDVQLPDVSNAARAIEEVGKVAQLYFYDWETNVIGPTGQPAPTDGTVTGDTSGDGPGGVESGLPYYAAVERALLRKPILRPHTDTTWEILPNGKGCTAALNAAASGANHGCIYGSWYLLNDTDQTVVTGPADTEADLYQTLSSLTPQPPKKDKLKAVRVNPGTVVVEATAETAADGSTTVQFPNSWYVLDDRPVLNGGDITDPQSTIDNGPGGTGEPIVTFGFTSHAGPIFQSVTAAIAQRGLLAQVPGVTKAEAEQHFAIVLDNQLVTVPYIDYTANPDGIDPTNGSEIQGGFTATSAANLAQELQSGALPLKLSLISNATVSATLGQQALSKGLLAGGIGLLLVCLFLLIFYRVLGVIAIGGLAVYGAYFFALIKLIPVTLSLAGIAGLILTIGVAADANIVIFERVKEEIRGGRSIVAGIATGYKRGFEAIVDANVVTIMVAFILFVLSNADVKGFALTLGIGTLVSLFTAVLATRAALGAMGTSRLISNPAFLGAAKERKAWGFDFMGASKWFFSLSGTILLIGALAIGGRGLNLGIDFKGGTQIKTGLIHPATVNQVKTLLTGLNSKYSTATIQALSGSKDGVKGSGVQISMQTLSGAAAGDVRTAIDARFGERPGTYSINSIGKTFGKTIADAAVIAIIASLLVISIYIALRFEWKYAIPVMIALMHDLLITAGVYALTGRPVTADTVAALLTILGYSLYDTIIVFDRVRENVPRMPRAAFSQIVNRSMSEVLTRSLATSFCTLLPVVALLFFGGTTSLSDFAFALLIGVASGAYSSIFIASPVLTHWKEREPVYRNRRARITAELGFVPAYAMAIAGGPVDVEPVARRRPVRRGMAAPQVPGDQLSQAEFEELVRDIEDEVIEEAQSPASRGLATGGNGAGAGASRPQRGQRSAFGGGGAGTAAPPPRGRSTPTRGSAPAPRSPQAPPPGRGTPPPGPQAPAGGAGVQPPPDSGSTADALPEDVVMPSPRNRPPKPPTGGRRNKRHGRPR